MWWMGRGISVMRSRLHLRLSAIIPVWVSEWVLALYLIVDIIKYCIKNILVTAWGTGLLENHII